MLNINGSKSVAVLPCFRVNMIGARMSAAGHFLFINCSLM